jgi:TRAP transporter TAXI family solute receptor
MPPSAQKVAIATSMAVSLLAGAVLAGGACRPRAATPVRQPLRLMLYGGNRSFSERLTQEFARTMPDLDVQLLDSGGFSVGVIEALERGDADLGFALADAAYFSSYRASGQEPAISSRIRGISLLQIAALHLIVRHGLDVRRIADLSGRAVRVGPQTVGATSSADTMVIAELLLKAFGLNLQSLHIQPSTVADAAKRLATGQLDAMFVNAAYPLPGVSEAIRAGAYLLQIEGPAVDELVARYPFLHVVNIPSGTYDGQTKAYRTIGVNVVFLCRSDLDGDLVYRLTQQFFTALPRLAVAEPSLQTMDIDEAPSTPVPLHEGAARYYREQELFR